MRFFACTMMLMLLLASPASAFEKASEARQKEVAQHGAQVMPFSLERTLHIFTKTKTGGVQQVIVKDKSDADQIRLIRQHLSTIAGEFAQGDFSAPEKIHGKNMPGLAELENAKTGQLKIEYRDLPDGGQIDYSTHNPQLIHALHRWFDAQLADHAGYAEPSRGHHMENMQPPSGKSE
jgi:hypothetical protein